MLNFTVNQSFTESNIYQEYKNRRKIRILKVEEFNNEKLEMISEHFKLCKETKSLHIEKYNEIGEKIPYWGGKISGKTRQEKNDLAISLLLFLREQNKDLFCHFSINTLEILSIQLFNFSPTERSLATILIQTKELKRITNNGRVFEENINVVENIIKSIIFNSKNINKIKKEFFYRYSIFRNDVMFLNLKSNLAYNDLKLNYDNVK